METTALVATLTSIMTIGLAVVTARLLRQERRRSDARVRLLSGLAAAAQPAIGAPVDTPMAPPVRLEPRTRGRRAAASSAPPGTSAAAAPDLFGAAPARTGIPIGYVFAGAIAMAGAIALGFEWALPSTSAPEGDTLASVAAPAAPVPLSLVSLRHEQHAGDGSLVISGVVRNPPGGAARDRLFAAASLLDGNGELIATARAPLDFTSLAPGDESPFVVRVAGAAGVARYRVGFRDATGASVVHVDGR